MKKSILILSFFICSFYGSSQSLFGARTGVNVSNLDFAEDPTVQNSHRNGFFIGFLAEYNLSERFLFSPELQFSAEGAKFEQIRVDYIQAPILFKYFLDEVVAFGVGPQIGIKTHKYEDNLTNLAFSAVGSIEYRITTEFFVDFRYTYGLTNIFDKEFGVEAINTSMQFGGGIKF